MEILDGGGGGFDHVPGLGVAVLEHGLAMLVEREDSVNQKRGNAESCDQDQFAFNGDVAQIEHVKSPA